MQNITSRSIMPAVGLTCIHTDKFKTGTLSFNIITALDKGSASKNALIPKVLRRGTSSNPDMESISAVLDELYGASIEPVVRKKGELQAVGFFAQFIDDKYVPAGERVLEKITALMGEMILDPSTSGGLLRAEYVDSEREKLIDEIRAGINNKMMYSLNRLIECMCSGERFGVNKLGSEAAASKITAQALTKHYRNLIATSRIEIIYSGSAGIDRVQQAVTQALSNLPRGEIAANMGTEIIFEPARLPPVCITEELDVQQGNLAVGFRVGEYMKAPSYAELMVFNAMYGGDVTSKLFMNVRERLSLCYYASSILDRQKGVIMVVSGIEFSKYDQALEEIAAQMEAMRQGDFDGQELENAKKSASNSLRSIDDSPMQTDDYFLTQAILGTKILPMELAALAEDVEAEAITKIAAGVKMDTVYFLKGLGGDGDED